VAQTSGNKEKERKEQQLDPPSSQKLFGQQLFSWQLFIQQRPRPGQQLEQSQAKINVL
jgi:hypothetical protein